MSSWDSRTDRVNPSRPRAAATPAEVIERYLPHHPQRQGWPLVAGFVRDCVRELDPPTVTRAHEWMKVITRFVVWGIHQGWPLDREVLFTPDNVEYYASTALDGYAPGSVSTTRSNLRRFSRQLTTTAPWPQPPPEIPGWYRDPPYASEDVAGFHRLRQRNDSIQRRLEATLALGLGAGLSAREYYLAHPSHLTRDEGITYLAVGGDRARTVPIRRRYARILWRFADTDPEVFFLGTVEPLSSSSQLSHLLRPIEVPRHLPPLRTERLRSTWLVHHINCCVDLPAFLAAAGLKSTRTITNLLPYLDHSDDAMAHGARLMADLEE